MVPAAKVAVALCVSDGNVCATVAVLVPAANVAVALCASDGSVWVIEAWNTPEVATVTDCDSFGNVWIIQFFGHSVSRPIATGVYSCCSNVPSSRSSAQYDDENPSARCVSAGNVCAAPACTGGIFTAVTDWVTGCKDCVIDPVDVPGAFVALTVWETD